MKTQTLPVDIRLERDPRYTPAIGRLAELKAELNALILRRDDVQNRIGSLAGIAKDQITQEAAAMISGAPSPSPNYLSKEELLKTNNELAHRIAVLREAISMQQGAVDSLRTEISEMITRDMLPQHQANVRTIVDALLQLNAAFEAEADLREFLRENDVVHSTVIRPMQMYGVGTLRDSQGRIFRYLLECYEYGFVTAGDLPDVVRDQIPPPVKRTPPPANNPVLDHPKSRLDDNWN